MAKTAASAKQVPWTMVVVDIVYVDGVATVVEKERHEILVPAEFAEMYNA